jgi:hypothetical protein
MMLQLRHYGIEEVALRWWSGYDCPVEIVAGRAKTHNLKGKETAGRLPRALIKVGGYAFATLLECSTEFLQL